MEYSKHSGGRPTVITDVVVVKLIAAFQNGMSDRVACQYAGIDKSTYYRKCNEDQRFCDQMQGAKDFLKLQAGQRVVQIISKGSDRDAGPMARWLLEKREPEMYGNRNIAQQNNQQNNYFVLNAQQIEDLANIPEIANSDPSELLEYLENFTEEKGEAGSTAFSSSPSDANIAKSY